jgi:hypothetical protein
MPRRDACAGTPLDAAGEFVELQSPSGARGKGNAVTS